MKCPYVVHTQAITQQSNRFSEDGSLRVLVEIQNSVAVFPDCLKEDCGAWKNGQCCYKGGA